MTEQTSICYIYSSKFISYICITAWCERINHLCSFITCPPNSTLSNPVSGKVTHFYHIGDGYINAITVIIVLRSRFWRNCVNIIYIYYIIVLIPLFYHYYCMKLHYYMKYTCHDHNKLLIVSLLCCTIYFCVV